jgi:hypothetical protein
MHKQDRMLAEHDVRTPNVEAAGHDDAPPAHSGSRTHRPSGGRPRHGAGAISAGSITERHGATSQSIGRSGDALTAARDTRHGADTETSRARQAEAVVIGLIG